MLAASPSTPPCSLACMGPWRMCSRCLGAAGATCSARTAPCWSRYWPCAEGLCVCRRLSSPRLLGRETRLLLGAISRVGIPLHASALAQPSGALWEQCARPAHCFCVSLPVSSQQVHRLGFFVLGALSLLRLAHSAMTHGHHLCGLTDWKVCFRQSQCLGISSAAASVAHSRRSPQESRLSAQCPPTFCCIARLLGCKFKGFGYCCAHERSMAWWP